MSAAEQSGKWEFNCQFGEAAKFPICILAEENRYVQ